jgi:hypothetical protein
MHAPLVHLLIGISTDSLFPNSPFSVLLSRATLYPGQSYADGHLWWASGVRGYVRGDYVRPYVVTGLKIRRHLGRYDLIYILY